MYRTKSFFLACLTLVFCLPALLAEEAKELEVGDPVEDVGTFLDLSNGGKLQLLVEDNQIIGYFVDADNNLVEVPAESVLFEVNDSQHRQDRWRTLLKPDGPLKVTSPRLFYGSSTFTAKVIVRYPDSEPDSFGRIVLHLDRNL